MFLVQLISYTPLRILYVFSDFIYGIAFHLVRYRRKLVWKNLKNSFPEKSDAELRIIEKEFYRNLCDYAVETLKLLTISKEELARRMVFKNPEIPNKHAALKQPVLILTSHQFNWEWLLTAASFNFPVPVDFVYQKVNNQFFEKISMRCRTRFGAYPIKRDEVGREMIKRRHILRAVAMVADQYPGYGRDKKYATLFLNQQSVFFQGTNQLALLTQYPVLYYEIKKIRRGYYETHAIEIANPPYSNDSLVVVERYVRAVENLIRKFPANWLWSHNRWKKRHLNQK
jgi:KDO2-lipid IV(A) lauroyltransferase